MCDCVNVEMGTFENQVVLLDRDKKRIGIDACLVVELAYLWQHGIKTTWNCCGHNKVRGIIIVTPDCYDRMRELGYEGFDIPGGRTAFEPQYMKPTEATG